MTTILQHFLLFRPSYDIRLTRPVSALTIKDPAGAESQDAELQGTECTAITNHQRNDSSTGRDGNGFSGI